MESGVDVNSKDCMGTSALAMAARYGHKHVVDYLIDHDADVNASSLDGESVLHAASFHGHIDVVQALCAAGASLDVCGEEGYTPLHEAVRKSREIIVATLLRFGADPSIQTNRGQTPLDLAHTRDIKDMLIDALDKRSAPVEDGLGSSDTSDSAAMEPRECGGVTLLSIGAGSKAHSDARLPRARVDRLCSMGFPEEAVCRALNEANGDVDLALELLLEST